MRVPTTNREAAQRMSPVIFVSEPPQPKPTQGTAGAQIRLRRELIADGQRAEDFRERLGLVELPAVSDAGAVPVMLSALILGVTNAANAAFTTRCVTGWTQPGGAADRCSDRH